VVELMRRVRGVCMVGPTCSGKTSLLKIVSNSLNKAYGVKMRTSVVNTQTFSQTELYGSIEAFSDKKAMSLF
jgi:ABC-type cobalamin/Fe3+-siderophores transport system ATPase subunit